jgi:PAS domain S-box-containing protein
LKVRSILCVPLLSRGRAMGVLQLVNKQDGSLFGESDLQLLSTFAGQAGIALENARLHDETNRRLQQVDILFKVGSSLTTLDTGQVLSTVAEQTVSALGVDVCGVYVYEQDRLGAGWTVLKALHDPSGSALDLLGTRHGVLEQTWLRELIGEPGYIALETVEPDEHPTQTLGHILAALAVRSCLLVGLTIHDEPHGFIIAGERQESRAFSPEEIQLCQAMAHQAVVAVENASLYERTDDALSKRLQELATIEEIDRELGTRLDYNHVIDLVLRRAIEACGATSGAIGIIMPDGQRLDTRFLPTERPDGARVPSAAEWPVDRGIVGRVTRTGQPALVADVTTDPDYEERVPATRSEVAVPIKREGRVIGVLNLESDRPAAFTSDNLRFVEHLADHAGIAIENARLFAEEQRRATDLATLNQVSTAVSSVLEPDEVLETIVDSVIRVTGCQKAAIFVLEHERVSLRMSQGLSDAYLAASQDIKVALDSRAQVLLGDEPLVVTDIETDPRLADFVPLARKEGFRALADVTLRGREEVLGEFTVYYDQAHHFSAVELDTLKTFANQAAIALENARLFQKEHQRVQMLSAISEISREIRAGLDLERTLYLILARVRDLVDYYIAEICLWNEDEQLMVTWASAGDARYTARTGGIYRLDEGFTGWIARNQQQLLVPDIAGRQDVRPKIIAEDTPVRSYMGLPLRTGETFVGTLELASDQRGFYTRDDLEILQSFADQAAVAIESARLYEETQQRFEQTQLLLRVSSAISSTLDLAETVRRLAREMARALEADMAGVYMADEESTYLQAVAGYHVPKEKLEFYREFRIPIQGHRFIQEAWETRQAVHSIDPANDTRVDPETIAVFPNQTTLFAPMVARDEVIGGVYLVWREEKKRLSHEELQMANAIARQAGAVVENARLFEAQQRQLRELGILFETSAAVSSSIALDDVLSAVARQMARALNVSSCSISNWDPATNTVTTLAAEATTDDIVASLSTRDVGLSYSLAEYPATAEVLRDRQPCVVQLSDPDADASERELLAQMGQSSLLMVPLVSRDRVVGLAELYEGRHERQFSPADVRLCEAIANQAAIAIENARLYEQTDESLQARVDELMAVQRITQELNATLDLDRILQVVLGSAVQTTGASHGNVMLMDLDTGGLTLRIAEGYSAGEQARISQELLDPDGDSVTRQVVESGQSRIVDDAARESGMVCVRDDTRSALVVPVFYQDTVVGLINLRHTEVKAFDGEDLNFTQALADQAAIAIGNAMRFEDQVRANTALRRRTEQMDGLLQVGQKLRTDVPLEEALEEVAYAIQETVGYNVVMISVAEGLQGAEPVLRRVAAAGLPLTVFEEARQVLQPLARYERILRAEYRRGLCYFYPFQRREDWEAELHTIIPMPEVYEWEEGQWHPHDMLLAPLRGAGGRLLGHISVDDPRDGRRPSRQTLETLAIFANQATIAVENAHLYADTQRRADNLTLINEVGRALTQTLEPSQVLDIVVKGVALLLQCEMSAVFQLDPFDHVFAAVTSYGVDLDDLSSLRFAPGEGLVGQVAATGSPLVVPDADQQPGFVDMPMPVGSMMLVPIMVGTQVIGVLAAGSPRKYALAESDRLLLTTLADQAAVALESARLFTGTQQAAERLSLLNEIGRRAAAQLELQDMLETTVQALHQHLGFFRVAVLLMDEGAKELHVEAANEDFWSVIPPRYRQKVGEGLIGTAAVTGRTVLANDAWADGRFFRVGEWGSPSSLSVPIKVAGKVIGVLEAEADQPRAFTEEDAAALEIAADQLAVAIQNARLFAETQRRVAELATINQIGRAISGALDADQLAELIYSQVSNLLDTRNFQITLYDATAALIHVEFNVQNGQRQPPAILTLGQGLASHLVGTGQPLLLDHGIEEFLQEHGLTQEGARAKSWLGVPMVAEDRVIGTIAVESYDREDAFDQGHVDLLSTIAGQAAVAFQNAALFQERQHRIEQLAIINEMAQAVSSTLELDDLLETVYQQVSRFLDTANFFIALYDDEKDEIHFPFVVDPEQREDWSSCRGGEGLTGQIVETGEPLLLPTGTAGLYREAGREVHAGLCRSWLGVPMIAEDKVLGVIAVQSYEEEHVYNPEHRDLLATVAAQAVVAVRNAQLYQQIVRFSSELEELVKARTRDLEKALDELTTERDRAETLYRITSELGATLDLERVLQRALRLFADALGVEHGTITLLDQESGHLVLKATLDQTRDLPRDGWPTPLKEGVGLGGWVLENRRALLLSDASEDPRWIEIGGKEMHVQSVVSAPLSLGGDILGVLTLGHPESGYFTKEHLQLVTAAAAQIAIAVNNSDLYAFITDQADQLGSMVQTQQAEAAKSRAILESIADGVLVLDHNGRVLLVNPTAEEMLGFAAIALEGQHFRHMLGLGETAVHRDLAQLLYTELRSRLEATEEDESRPQARTVRLESEERVLAVNIAPLITTISGAPGLVAALRDISREAEVERLKNEFISTVSHELRTPMTSIKGYTDLLFLGMGGGLTDAQRSFLQIIKSNADRLTALVNDILDISRIETGRLRLTIEPLDLGKIITQVATVFQEQYREKGLSLEWEEPGQLPQVRGDDARVTQVLNNLIANAWQYTPSGGRVTISTRLVDGFLQVDVSDTGIGIAVEEIRRIFDRFYRVDHPVVQEAGGTGLGLSIVKMFVEMLGGEIWVESKLDVGSTFSFTLPLTTAEVPEVSADLLTTEPALMVSRRPKILVVEDDRDLALLLRRQLESEGYQVLLAGSGEDALWLAREEQPQLISLDIMLPDLDGFVVLERLKENPITAPIPVVITSVLTEADEGYALGAVDYVVKPFSEEKLLQAVRRALSPFSVQGPYDVLVVDDDPDIRGLMEEALSFRGYQVSTAPGGREALAHVRESLPDLILLDLKMPGVDGYEVIRQLKADDATRPVPIIVITASLVDQERDRVRVLGLGATQYITKPISIDTLIREIKKAIAEKQSG